VVVRLPDGVQATVKLLEIKETRDSLRESVCGADVTVELKGRGSFLKTSCVPFPLLSLWAGAVTRAGGSSTSARPLPRSR
jgi:hypothetical protein